MQYWPDKGSTTYGFLTVTMMNEEVFANYVIRTLSVEPAPHQLHYIKVCMVYVYTEDTGFKSNMGQVFPDNQILNMSIQ